MVKRRSGGQELCELVKTAWNTYGGGPVCETNVEGELPPLNLGGGVREAPRSGCRRPYGAVKLFFSYLVAISFPIEFDVWGRLCTHFEAAKVRTFCNCHSTFLSVNCRPVTPHKYN